MKIRGYKLGLMTLMIGLLCTTVGARQADAILGMDLHSDHDGATAHDDGDTLGDGHDQTADGHPLDGDTATHEYTANASPHHNTSQAGPCHAEHSDTGHGVSHECDQTGHDGTAHANDGHNLGDGHDGTTEHDDGHSLRDHDGSIRHELDGGAGGGGPVVPEPATMLLFGSGLVGAFMKRRQKS